MPSWIDPNLPGVLRSPENAPLRDCWGIIDNTHVRQTVRYEKTVSRNNYYSIKKSCFTSSILCICNLNKVGRAKFIYVSDPYLGRRNDGFTLTQELGNGLGQMIPPDKFIIADGGYAVCPWLVPTYSISQETAGFSEQELEQRRKQLAFNHLISKVRVRIEQNFGILKMTFQRLYRGNDFPVNRQNDVITSAFCICNFLSEKKGPSFEREERELELEIRSNRCDLGGKPVDLDDPYDANPSPSSPDDQSSPVSLDGDDDPVNVENEAMEEPRREQYSSTAGNTRYTSSQAARDIPTTYPP